MRLMDIICVLCLSSALMVFEVNSQNNCTLGWFGRGCKYQCRCVNNDCDKDGKCRPPERCQGGWFGPECQYADRAYISTNQPVLTDGDDGTCVDPSVPNTVSIALNESIVFTWLRVSVRNAGSAAIWNISLTFALSTVEVECSDLQKQAIDETSLDFHCNMSTKYFDSVTLKGAVVSSLCSVYISGGRNVALKETAMQEVTYHNTIGGVRFNYTADLAVDGDIRQDFNTKACSSTFQTRTWILILSQPRSVHRYVIYNRGESKMERLQGFSLESFDAQNRSLFFYRDTSPVPLQIYTFSHTPLPVSALIITSNHTDRTLTLCEVEVYGDSICDNLHYGRDCEKTCSCFGNETCFVSTGLCPTGCPNGYMGPTCTVECVRTFGRNCNQTCSMTCEQPVNSSMPRCDPITGACLTGCKPGYTGAHCETECGSGRFGEKCNSVCSQSCESPSDAKTPLCNPVTGVCTKGCNTGFTGASCTSACTAGTFGQDCKSECSQNCEETDKANSSTCDPVTGICLKGCKGGSSGERCESVDSAKPGGGSNIELIVGLCSVFATAFAVAYCLRKTQQNMRTRSSEEATAKRVT